MDASTYGGQGSEGGKHHAFSFASLLTQISDFGPKLTILSVKFKIKLEKAELE